MADRFCGNCGQELRPDGRFCPSCGQPTSSAAQPPAPDPATPIPAPQRQSHRPGTWGAGRILLLFVVAPVLLAVAWVVFQIALGFLNGLLGG